MTSQRLAIVGLVSLVLVVGCASFEPASIEEVPFRERAVTAERNGFRITVAVPDRDEAERILGVDLADHHIQPVWIEVENRTGIPYSIMLTAVDPRYFAPHEAAYRFHRRLQAETNRRIDAHFNRLAISQFVPANGTASGFVYTNEDQGTKNVLIRLYSMHRLESFEFDVSVPGFRADWHGVDFDALYPDTGIVSYATEQELHDALAELPCCTTRKDGTQHGDPLNLVFVGDGDLILNSLTRQGWDETEVLTGSSAWRTFRAAVTRGEYRHSPMSALYLYGRPQDVGFQKARDSIHERNHLRLWMAPMLLREQQVWIGTITRDIGVYFTRRTWNMTTHAIDPDVDESRNHIMEDLLLSQMASRMGFVAGIEPSTPEAPHRNLMNAPWWSDGHRLVIVFDRTPRTIDEIDPLPWDWPGEDDEALNAELRRLIQRD